MNKYFLLISVCLSFILVNGQSFSTKLFPSTTFKIASHFPAGENNNVLGKTAFINRTITKQNLVLENGNFSFHDTTFNVDGDIIVKSATVNFKNCTLNIQGNLNITASNVTFTGSKINIVLQRDLQYSAQIYDRSNITLDGTTMQGINYQTEFYTMAENGNSPSVILRNKSRCLNHAGFGFYNQSTVTINNSNIGEVQARDKSQITIQNSSAYLVFFYPQGSFSISDIHAGKNISRIIELPNLWKVTIQNADSLISGYQIDLYKGTNLTLNNSTDIVLSIHTPGNLSKKVSASGITKSFSHTDSLVTLGPKFYFNNSRIELFNIYTSGNDTVEIHNTSVNESSAFNNSVLIIGSPNDSTFAACNLMQTQNRGEIQFVNTTVKADPESDPSAFALDSSRIVFKNSDLQKLKIGATQISKIYISNCKNYNASLTHLFDNAQLFFSLPTSIKERITYINPEYHLFQNHPNPFNPTTTIRFFIPERSKVDLRIFDLLGREIIKLMDDELEQGEHSVLLDAHNLSSGIYFYRMVTHEFISTKKLLLLK